MHAPDKTEVKNTGPIMDDEKIFQSQSIQLPGGIVAQIEIGHGLSNKQEDRAGIETISNDTDLKSEQIAACLYNTVIKLGNQCMEQASGTTLVAAIFYKNILHIIAIGDSEALLLEKNSTDYIAKTLTTPDRPDDHNEHQRLEQSGANFYDKKRIMHIYNNGQKYTVTSVSRGIGDKDSGPGFTFIPRQENCQALPMKTNSDKFLLLMTDGITDTLTLDNISTIINDLESKDAKSIANHIRHLAHKKGSKDNKAILVLPLKNYNDQLILTYVCDGHRGSEVVTYVSENIASTFKKILYEQQWDKLLTVDEKYHEIHKVESSNNSAINHGQATKPSDKQINIFAYFKGLMQRFNNSSGSNRASTDFSIERVDSPSMEENTISHNNTPSS